MSLEQLCSTGGRLAAAPAAPPAARPPTYGFLSVLVRHVCLLPCRCELTQDWPPPFCMQCCHIPARRILGSQAPSPVQCKRHICLPKQLCTCRHPSDCSPSANIEAAALHTQANFASSVEQQGCVLHLHAPPAGLEAAGGSCLLVLSWSPSLRGSRLCKGQRRARYGRG